MSPTLTEGQFVFCSISRERRKALKPEPLYEFHEAEGVTVVLRLQDAVREKIDGEFLSRLIRLDVTPHSDAVGMLSVISTRLATHGVSIQPVAGVHHGYLFVPEARGEESVKILESLAAEYRAMRAMDEGTHPVM
jgi:hypothetical protein